MRALFPASWCAGSPRLRLPGPRSRFARRPAHLAPSLRHCVCARNIRALLRLRRPRPRRRCPAFSTILVRASSLCLHCASEKPCRTGAVPAPIRQRPGTRRASFLSRVLASVPGCRKWAGSTCCFLAFEQPGGGAGVSGHVLHHIAHGCSSRRTPTISVRGRRREERVGLLGEVPTVTVPLEH